MFKKHHKEGTPPSDTIITFLGKGVEFKGVITYYGTIRIDGKVEGEIITEGTLIVGESANIQANISAGAVISGGKIVGSIQASHKVHLLPKAVMIGSLNTPTLIIEEGVVFNGKADMSKTERQEGVRPLRAVGNEG